MDKTVFSAAQFQQIYPDGIENHYWNHARNAIIYRFIKSNRLQYKNILEIGGGRGIVVKYLVGKGVSCIGVEQADVLPVAGVSGFFYPRTDAFNLPAEERETFEVVLLLDVIEHIVNPADFMQKILAAFPNLSHILVTVPARQELWTNYDSFNGHYRRYGLRDLRELTNERITLSGAGYFNHLLYPVFWLYAKWLGERETVVRAPTGLQIAIYRVLSFILQADFILLPGKLWGTSAMALYRVVRG